MEVNLKWLYDYGLTFGKILGYAVILIGIVITYLLLKTILFD